MAGYSKTPLAKKLGIRAGSRLAVLDAPEGFLSLLEPLPEDVEVMEELDGGGDLDVIVLFSHRLADLRERLPRVAPHLAAHSGLWIAWPKKASGVETDLSFDEVQHAGLSLGLVDNKVCAVSEVYSGLRFVVRKEDRERWASGEGRRTR